MVLAYGLTYTWLNGWGSGSVCYVCLAWFGGFGLVGLVWRSVHFPGWEERRGSDETGSPDPAWR